MSDRLNYLECWTSVATSLFTQALAGEPILSESLPKPMGPNPFGFAATVVGDEEGRFAILLEGSLLDAALLGEGADQKAGWSELLKEVAEAASGELLAKSGKKTRVAKFEAIDGDSKLSRAFQLKSGARSWSVQVNSTVRVPKPATTAEKVMKADVKPPVGPEPGVSGTQSVQTAAAENQTHPGFQLLLDVELEASLRFGAREMPLGEILGLGPGDIVQLDRHITDPVESIVGDKIVARGEVVLVEGNFGLRVTEVAEPRNRLESIRCLF